MACVYEPAIRTAFHSQGSTVISILTGPRLSASAPPKIVPKILASGIPYVQVTGDLVFQHYDRLVHALEAYPIQGGLILDLTECRFVDSTTVGFFVKLHKAMQQKGSRFALIVPPGIIRRSLEISRLDQVLILATDLDSVLNSWQVAAE